MVSTQQVQMLWQLQFVCQQQTNSFDTLLSTIHIIPANEMSDMKIAQANVLCMQLRKNNQPHTLKTGMDLSLMVSRQV